MSLGQRDIPLILESEKDLPWDIKELLKLEYRCGPLINPPLGKRSLEPRERSLEARLKERVDIVSGYANRVAVHLGEEQTRSLIEDLSTRLSLPSQVGRPWDVLGRILAALTLEQLLDIEPIVSTHLSRNARKNARPGRPAGRRSGQTKVVSSKRRRRAGRGRGRTQRPAGRLSPRSLKPEEAPETACYFRGCGVSLSDEDRRFSKLHSEAFNRHGYCAVHAAPLVALLETIESDTGHGSSADFGGSPGAS